MYKCTKLNHKSKLKIIYFDEYTKDNNVIHINMTGTWFNERIQIKTDLEYESSEQTGKTRQDGVLICVNGKLERKQLLKISQKKCEHIALSIPAIITINSDVQTT